MGNKKRIFLFIVIFMFFAVSGFTKQISIQIVQHAGTEEALNEQTLVIEDELLNGFFEYGYIVTNSPAAVSKNKSDDEILWSVGLADAYEGSSDFYIQIDLYYKLNKGDLKEEYIVNKVDWLISSVKSAKKIKNGTIKSKSGEINNISSQLIFEIYKVINANKA